MSQKILPHFWFDTQAVEATAWYAKVLPNSQVLHVEKITDTPSGDCDIVSFKLSNLECMAISAGPYFSMNPSISLFVDCTTEAEADELWSTLSKGGEVLMEYGTQDWATKYGWCNDKYGMSWQISYTAENSAQQVTIRPAFLFTQAVAGKAQQAMELYTSLLPNSAVGVQVPYPPEMNEVAGGLMYSEVTLAGVKCVAMDSSADHKFTFNEGVSLYVRCEDQAELDRLTEQLSAVPEAEQCGWVKDKFGVSWQLSPIRYEEMMKAGTPEQKYRTNQAMLQMKRLNVAELEKAFKG